MSCCLCLARTIIGLVNLIILIVMAVILYFSWDQIKQIKIDEIKSSKKVLIFVIVVVAIIAITCIIGFFLLCCDSKCFRMTYAILYFIIVIAEIVLVYFTVKAFPKIIDDTEDWWNENKGKQSVKDIESDLECCGFKTAYNAAEMANCGYQQNNTSNSTDNNITDTNSTENNTTGNVQTCYNKIDENLNKSKKGLKIAGIVVIVVQALLLIYSIWYGCCYKRHKKDKSSSTSSS
ncbi:tetraspanin family [Trichomonas vaginalis G3]|uniref:tetraspanin family n=1 Tax=Trichomonas vaginalis (strain ATCC PRA-98 / G3) TaxID=412133 RepID=UPI0021E5A018|nr:tetraspanin family [Trichomonas vaginalis G3]KAI5512749.1 tetraspanin family [Trichomonas vaginalis G3]